MGQKVHTARTFSGPISELMASHDLTKGLAWRLYSGDVRKPIPKGALENQRRATFSSLASVIEILN